jgi:hypothetical protein
MITLHSKCITADKVTLYRDLAAIEGWQCKIAAFDAASEVSNDYITRINQHFFRRRSQAQSLPTMDSANAQVTNHL